MLVPLFNISRDVEGVIGAVEGVVGGVGAIGPSMNNVTVAMHDLTSYIAAIDFSTSTGPEVDPCTFCQEQANAGNDITAELSANVNESVNAMDATLNDVNDNLIGAQDMIQDTTTMAEDAVQGLEDKINDGIDNYMCDAKEYVSVVDKAALSVGIAMFGTTFATFAAMTAGFVLMFIGMKCLRILGHIGWIITGIVIFLSLVAAGVFIPVSVVISDVCYGLNLVTDNMDDYMTFPGSNMVQACFDGTPVLAALDLGDSLSFADTLNFTFPAPDFSLPALQSMSDDIQALTITDLGWTDPMQQCYDEEAGTGCNDGSEPHTTVANTRTSMLNTIDALQRRDRVLQSRVNWMEGRVDGMGAKMDVVSGHVQPLIDYVKGLNEYGDCSFIGKRWNNILDALCGTSLNGLLMTGVCLAIVGVLDMPLVVFCVILIKRMKKMDKKDEDKLMMAKGMATTPGFEMAGTQKPGQYIGGAQGHPVAGVYRI
jgi:hypothetical protein